MALQDILDAISAHADQRIAEARSEHNRALTQLREASERRIARKKQEIAMQKEERRAQLHAKADAHAEALKRNALLTKKQELLDRVYAQVIDKLAALPDDKVEPLLRICLKNIKGKGTITPAEVHQKLLKKIAPSEQFEIGSSIKAKGGFQFSSKTQEHDFTFEHLVMEELRPRTSVQTSTTLFA